MKRIISLYSRNHLSRYLRSGGIIAYPTESCYGLGAAFHQVKSINKIIALKKRPQHKGMIVIAYQLAQLQSLLQKLPENQQSYLHQQWPAAKTFLLPANRKILPKLRGSQRDKLAVRVPDHEIARALCYLAQAPLISTSCNKSGRRPCKTQREVKRQFGNKVLVIGNRVGQRKNPSEIIDLYKNIYLR